MITYVYKSTSCNMSLAIISSNEEVGAGYTKNSDKYPVEKHTYPLFSLIRERNNILWN